MNFFKNLKGVDNVETFMNVIFLVIGILGILFLIGVEIMGIYSLIFDDEKIFGIICVIFPLILLLRFTKDFWEGKLNLWDSKIWLKGKNKNGWTNEELRLIYSIVMGFISEINSESINQRDDNIFKLFSLPINVLLDLKMSQPDINELEKNNKILNRHNYSIDYDKLKTITLDKKKIIIESLYSVEKKSWEINQNINQKKSGEFLLKSIMKIDPDNETGIGVEKLKS